MDNKLTKITKMSAFKRLCFPNGSFVLIFLALLLGAQSPCLAKLKNDFELGLGYFTDNRHKRALIHFYKYLEKHPRDVKSYYYGGLASQRLNDTKRANILFRRAYMVAPQSKYGLKAKDILIRQNPSFALSTKAKAQAAAKSSTRTASRRTSPRSSSKPRSNDTLPSKARVYFRSDGTQMIMKVRINGKPIDMKFDTGAPAAGSFGLNHLRQLGLPQPSGPPDGKVGGSSNSQKFPIWYYKVDMQIGSIIRKNIPIRVMGRNRGTPLLGQEFFKDYTYTIDYGGKSILFAKNHSQSNYVASSRYSVPFRFREAGNRIIVDLDIDGKKCPAMFDTGHTTDAVLAMNGRQQAKLYGIRIPANAPGVTTVGVSGSGTSRVVTVRRVKLGPIERYNAKIHVSDEERGIQGLPLLGQAFYRGWQYTIDMNKKLIHFKRR